MRTAFLSSTAKDLAEYREAAYEAIEGLDDWHCVRMEDFGARDAMADEFCQEKVAECDVFVGIVGHCYDNSPKDSEKSYTEQEYDAAIATDKPRLMFLAPEEFPLPAYLIEPDEQRAKQRAFRDRVNAERIRAPFTSPEALAWRVTQAIRNLEHEQVALGRLAKLEELSRASRARCIMRWQAAGVPRIEASELADDPSIGAPGPELQPRTERPILLLVGEIGAGKSLIAERLLQGAIIRAHKNTEAPVPVYLDAQSAVGQLQEAVEAATSGLGNPWIQGGTVIIDGADEVGTGLAAELLNEARVLTGTWPEITVIITSRPIPSLAEAEEAIQLPQLSEAERYALIGRLARRPVMASTAWGWPESVRDAVCRPLFAVLLGIYLREQDMRAPRSTGELLYSLVERSLGRAETDRTSANQLLQQLATLSTDRGGRLVPAAEVASRAELQSLLDSGLVVEHSGAIGFPLPILTQWFAAQSLAAGIPAPDDLASYPQRLEHWRYPLIIFAGAFGHDQVSRLLAPLAERHPALSAEIVNEGLARWGLAEDVQPPPPLECGQRVRTAMQAWTRGIGPAAQLIAPVDEDGMLLPVGARTDGTLLTIAWYRGDVDLPEVVELPSRTFHTLPPDCIRLQSAQPGHQPAWAWRWTLDELVARLSRLLEQHGLPVSEGPLAREAAWQAALAVTGHGSLHPGPIPIAETEEHLSRLPENASLVGISGRWYNLSQLRVEVNRLRGAGETELRGPWPGPDRDYSGGCIWDPYSDTQILARTEAVYAGALEGYRQLVDTWFPRLAPRLRIAVTLPARLVGVVVPPQPGKGIKGSPTIHWYLEALPHGSQSTVDLDLGEERMGAEYLRVANERVRDLRPEAASWISATLHHQILDVFHPNSATKLAYDWLQNDLERVHWV